MNKERRLRKSNTSFLEILLSPEISILIPLIVLATITQINNPSFLTLMNIKVILRNLVFIGLLSIGVSVVVMCGEIDMSVGTCSTLTGVVFGVALVWWNVPLWLAIVLSLATGVLVGGVNAFLTNICKISSWIVTMATQYICIGLSTVITKGHIIGLKDWGTAVYDWSRLRPLGFSWPFWIFIAFIVVGEFVIRFTPVGRKIHAVGLSVYAARIDGINVIKVKSLCQMFAGFMGAVCGMVQVAQTNTATNYIGQGNEFPAMIAAVIGGVSNTGGKGTMLGVFLGVVMYQTLKNCLQMLGANNNMQLVFLGLILILAVYVDVLKTKVSQRNRRAKKEAVK